MRQRLGILGGSFDPIHLGHLILGERAVESLSLDRLLFVPASIPPHKQDEHLSAADQRLELVQLAVAGNPNFEVSDIEMKRGGPSYTADTLEALTEDFPKHELVLILGADMVMNLPTWHRPEQIVRLARIAAARRPDTTRIDFSSLEGLFSPDQLDWTASNLIEMPAIGISSTEIRERCAAGRSIRYLVPAPVDSYIRAHELYRG
ncbi:Nicotinate-nucleotide adenylyltransferase [Planctomycetes bacterium Pan216]|uniref:Probable nicotinate-nucleotide adenylyltransferase n=1 Tax=Kolteria novifilia TaxID=2527975 RepID=A0A518B711_9BACT|nr:Nicotinate-nucleotide adenylyltransferase [Planctomycetes bacterium Pan216]